MITKDIFMMVASIVGFCFVMLLVSGKVKILSFDDPYMKFMVIVGIIFIPLALVIKVNL